MKQYQKSWQDSKQLTDQAKIDQAKQAAFLIAFLTVELATIVIYFN